MTRCSAGSIRATPAGSTGDDGAKLAVSARAFGYARDAQLAADVRLHAGSAAGTEER